MDKLSKQVLEEDIRIEEILNNIEKEVAELKKLTPFIQK